MTEFEAIFLRWLHLQKPEEIFELLKQRKYFNSHSGGEPWASGFFKAWVAIDEETAMQDPDKIAPPRIFDNLRALFAIRNAHLDFADYLDFENRGGMTGFSDRLPNGVEKALVELGRDHPNVARLLPPDKFNNAAITLALAKGMAMNEPAKAIEWVSKLGLTEGGYRHLSAVFQEWDKIDHSAAMRALQGDGVPENVALFIESATKGTETSSIMPSLQTHFSFAFEQDPFTDPKSLHERLASLEIDLSREISNISRYYFTGWFCHDLETHVRTAENLPAGDARDVIIASIALGLSESDPTAAIDLAEKHGLSVRHIENLKANKACELTREMQAEVFANPKTYLSALFNDDHTRTGLSKLQLKKAVNEYLRADPVEMINWILNESPMGADTLSYGEGVQVDLHLLARNTLDFYWAKHDTLAAVDWLDSLPDPEAQARVLRFLHDPISKIDPALYFELTANYTTHEHRLNILAKSAGRVKTDIGLPVALDLIESSPLSNEERAILIEQITPQASEENR